MDNSRFYGGGSSSRNHSSKENDSDPGPIPDRWLHCPHIANTILAGRFLAFKTPLSARFSPKIDAQHRFQPEMAFAYMKIEKVIGNTMLLILLYCTFCLDRILCMSPLRGHTQFYSNLYVIIDDQQPAHVSFFLFFLDFQI